MHIRKYLFQAMLFTASVFLFGQLAQAIDFKFSGEVRPRTELATNGAVGAAKNQHKSFTTMRTRLGLRAIVDSDTSAFIQLQDVRTAGGETPTTAPPSITQTGTSVAASGLDLHQGYIDLGNVLGTGIHLRLGRQEMIFDEHRLIGNIGWIQQAQTCDAARADVDLGQFINGLSLTAFFAKTVASTIPGTTGTHPTLQLTNNSNATFDSNFAGARLTFKLGDKGDRITPYFYYALNPAKTGKTPIKITDNIEYVGAYLVKHVSGFRFRFDGAYEFGNVNAATDIKAYMLTAAIGTKLDIAHGFGITAWYDYLSGDNNPNDATVHTFTTPYATNHAYYGHIDKFLNIPTQGLQDIAVKMWLKPTQKMKFIVHLHQFMSAKTSTAANPPRNLGQEIDTHFKYPLAKHTMLALGYSHYFGNGTVNGGVTGDTTLDSNWAYGMVDFKF